MFIQQTTITLHFYDLLEKKSFSHFVLKEMLLLG